MQDAVIPAQGETDMRRAEEPAVVRDNPDDVTAAQLRLNRRDPVSGNLIERPTRDAFFHLAERSEERAVRCEITIMFPAARHLLGGVRHAHAAEAASQVFDKTAAIIIG